MRQRRIGAVGVCAVVLLLSAGASQAARPTARAGPDIAGSAGISAPARTTIAGCPVFPANNYWNTDISGLAVSKHSDAWLSHMSPGSFLHPDFGRSDGAQPVPYGIPITLVDDNHPTEDVTFQYKQESDHVRYPLGSDTKIEGGRHSSGDRHAIVVNTDTCRLYETWDTARRNGRWYAGSGATWNLRSNRLRPDGWTSADAAGLAILPGLLRYDEVEVAGHVTHAIRFTTDETRSAHRWPARHDAGSQSSRDYPPMGARFRLKAGFPLAGYRPDTIVVLQAMKTYGLVLADNGSAWYFQGSADRRWPAGLIRELKTIPAAAFEAVNTAPLEVHHNSGRAG